MAVYCFSHQELGALLHILQDDDSPLALTHLKHFTETSLSSAIPEANANIPEALTT